MVKLYASDDQQQGAPYEGELEMRVSYVTPSGEIPLSVSGGPGELVAMDFVSGSAPLTLKVVDWTASRFAFRPQIPHAKLLDNEHVLLLWTVEAFAPDLTPDGNEHLYVIRGTHIYGMRTPLFPGQEIPLGKLPIDTTDRNDIQLKIPADAYQPFIADKPPSTEQDQIEFLNPIQG